MADENVTTSTEKPISIDKPKTTINPITGKPFGGGTVNPETNMPDKNPITGQKFGLGLVNSEGKANYGGYSPSFPTLGTNTFSPSNIFTDTYTMYNQEPMENYKEYGVNMGRHFDWDELRARNQSSTETVLRGAGKALVTFGGALLENTIGFFAGMGEMATGGAYYDNAIGKTVDKWNNWAQEAMPTYLTEAEQNYSTWEKMGTAHFWADDVLGGMAYTAAAAASIYLTGGGGLLTKGAKMATTAALGRTALYNTTKAVINGTKLTNQLTQGVNLTNRLYSAAQVLEAGAMMSLAEASVEARETQKSTYDNLVQSYLNEHKTGNIDDIPKEKLREFEEVSYHAGNTNFVMQMPVLMGTNLLMFGRSVSGFKVGSTINKDVVWNTATSSYVSKLADKGFMSATLSKLKPFAQQGLNEAFQEIYQFGSSAFANTYHIDKYNNNGNGDISKALAAGWDAMGTQEGIESALIGFITGGFFGGSRAITSRQYSNRVEQADKLAALQNGGELINPASAYQDANAVSAASVRMELALKNGDIKGYQDARFSLIAAQTMENLERGGLEMYIDRLQESSNLSDSEFKKLYGYLETDAHGDPITIEKQSNGKNKHEIIDGIVEKIRTFEKTYNDVNDRFPLPQRTTGLPRLLTSKEKIAAEDKVYNESANLRNELIFSAAGIKDRNRRMSNIQNSIQETANDVYLYNRDARGQDISMSDVLGDQQPSHKGIKAWVEPGTIEAQKAFVGEAVGVDEQGNKIYAPGAKIDPNVSIEDQNIGEQPDRYDPTVQLIETQIKLKAVEDQVRQSDPLSADKIAELNKDYIELLSDNNYSIKRYNELSSNKYAQEQWTNALNEAIDKKIQDNIDKEVIKVAQEAKTSKDISDHFNTNPNASPEAAKQANERFEQLKKDENSAYKKYLNTAKVATSVPAERLKVLEDIDQSNLTESEKEGLRQAIKAINKLIKEEKLKEKSDEVTEEDVEVKETKKEIEEELSPENTGGVESISEDGRVFQIEGTQYYNREDNPLDAIIEKDKRSSRRDVTGDPSLPAVDTPGISIKLQNEQGDTHFIKAPQARVEALYYAILASEQYKVDSTQGIAKQDIVNRSTVIIEENKKELKPTIKDAKKDSSSLRSEMYGLERSLDELLETQDQLRTSLIQDDNATKKDINANPTIKALRKQIKNTKAAITRRRNVLLNRNESVTPTITEITAVEQKVINDVNVITKTINELDKQILTAEETVKRTEALMEKYQDDPGSFQQVSKENADAKAKINSAVEETKQLYTLIDYKKQKLRRLENEKQNRPTDPTKQTTPEDTEQLEKPITEGENPNTETVPQEEGVTVATNLGYQRVNSNNYILNPDTGSFTRVKNATDVNIPGYPEVEAFTYKDQNGDTLVVDSLTGTVLGKNKVAKLAGKQAVETLAQGITDQNSPTEMFGNIINENKKVSPAYEPINTVKEQENFTSSEKSTQKVLTIENGKDKILDSASTPGPGKRGGMVVMTQAEVDEHERQVSKDLSEVISDAAQQEIDENKPYGNTQSVRSWVDDAVREGYRQISNSTNPIELKRGDDLSNISYEEGERHLQEIIDLIDKRVRMNQILLDKGKEAYSVDKVIEEVMYKHNTSDILRQAQIGQVAALHRYIKRKMNPAQPITAAPTVAAQIAELDEKAGELEQKLHDDAFEQVLPDITKATPETIKEASKAGNNAVENSKELKAIIAEIEALKAPAAPVDKIAALERRREQSIKDINARTDYSAEEKKSAIIETNQHLDLELRALKQEAPAAPLEKTTIKMSSSNINKILSGTKTTTIRASIPKGGNIKVGETKTVNFGGKNFNVTNRGYLTIEEAGGVNTMLKSEGLSSINDFMFNQSKNWANGKGKMYVYDIKPEVTAAPGEQMDLFGETPMAPTMSMSEIQKTTSYLDLSAADQIFIFTNIDIDAAVRFEEDIAREKGELSPESRAKVIKDWKDNRGEIITDEEIVNNYLNHLKEQRKELLDAQRRFKEGIGFGEKEIKVDWSEISEQDLGEGPGNVFGVVRNYIDSVYKSMLSNRLAAPAAPVEPVEQQIKKSDYEVHVTGDMLSGWDMTTTPFNVPGIKIKDLRNKTIKEGKNRRLFTESVQNNKKVFTLTDGNIYRGGRQAGISASMVFNENTSHTLEDVKGSLTAIMDGLLGVRGKYSSSFTTENINQDWRELDVKEIATPSVIMEESAPSSSTPSIVKTEMTPVVTKSAHSNPETFKPWFIDTVSDSQDSKNIYKELSKLVEIGKNLDNKNTTWKFGDLRADVDGRPMISIDIIETGESFIMYKSVSEDVWVPIPGFAKNGWFVKNMWNGSNPKFSKYGIETFQEIADTLTIAEVIPNKGVTIPGQTAEVEPRKTYESNLSVKLGMDTKTSKVPGDDTTKYNIPVDDEGKLKSYNPDMLNGDPIEIDKSVLLDPTVYDKQVEFELIPNDWYTATYPEGNWKEAPIYVKIDGKYIGRLSADKTKEGSEERERLVKKLQAGEKVTTKINKIHVQNYNWAKTEDHQSWFYNPNEVMERGQVILAFTEIEDYVPYWTISKVADSKDQGDLPQIIADIGVIDKTKSLTDHGQVGIVIRRKNSPAGIPAKVSPGSTQNLTSAAKKAVLEALKIKNHDRARQIIANSKLREAANSPTFLEFFEYQDGTKMMVYRSPKVNKLVKIDEHDLAKVLARKTITPNFVEVYDNEGELEYRAVNQDQLTNIDKDLDIKEDFENFINKNKKYHIDRHLANIVSSYTSPVNPKYKYNSYQEYLFAEREIGEERSEGFGHNSIFATDLVQIDGSFFNNPKVEFGKGDLKGQTVQDISNPVKQESSISLEMKEEARRLAEELGLLDDTDIPDCPQ